MKLRKFALLLLALSVFMSCKKQDKAPETRGVIEFTSTIYTSMGGWDSSGRPTYLVSKDVVSNNLLSFINTTLPNKQDLRKTNPDLLTTKAIADIALTSKSDVYITYVSQGGSATSTFAFYTYPTNKKPASVADIKVITYVFPNSGSRTTLQRGDKVNLGTFEAGTSIGFLIMKNGWDITTHTINNKVAHFTSNDVLNPEVDANLQKHAVLINYPDEDKVLIGFEDTDRTDPKCDHDFNDVVFYCTVTPK